MFIERISIQEWRSAGPAEKLCLQGFGKGEAGGTDRNSGEITQRPLTNPAVVGEEKVETFAGGSI
jgi:hypothetical protein